MKDLKADNSKQYLIDVEGLSRLMSNLKEVGYTLVGPKVVDQAIVYDELDSIDDLPVEWQDSQVGVRCCSLSFKMIHAVFHQPSKIF